VVRQQLCELVAGIVAVERLDRVADVHLVGQQSIGRDLEIRQVFGRGRLADDEQPGPEDVVLPQLAHRVVELRGGDRGAAGCLRAGTRVLGGHRCGGRRRQQERHGGDSAGPAGESGHVRVLPLVLRHLVEPQSTAVIYRDRMLNVFSRRIGFIAAGAGASIQP
jgi:hypothetical protein